MNRAVDVREQLLSAALGRFSQYGFAKTTMAEIAGDCGMSAANIYRYFPNKGDMAAIGAARWLAATEDRLAEIAHDRSASPESRLRSIILTRLQLLAELASRHGHINELVQHVCQERPELVNGHAQNTRRLIAAVLADGVAQGHFATTDTLATAETVHSATAMFYHFGFLRDFALADLSQKADRVLDLLIQGLAARQADMPPTSRPTNEANHD